MLKILNHLATQNKEFKEILQFYKNKKRTFKVARALAPFLKKNTDYNLLIQLELMFLKLEKVDLEKINALILDLVDKNYYHLDWNNFSQSLLKQLQLDTMKSKEILKSIEWLELARSKRKHIYQFMEDLLKIDLKENYKYRIFLYELNY